MRTGVGPFAGRERFQAARGAAWFGSVWGGFLGGIRVGLRARDFPHQGVLPDPLIIRTVKCLIRGAIQQSKQ